MAMTSTKVRTNVYIDANIKIKAKELFKKYGVSLSDAINIFLAQSVLEKGLPFEVKIPNDETKKAIEDAQAHRNIEQVDYNTHIEEMKKCISN
jgi:DNA-damage-inducible protein J